jgi:hypothetical protein
MLAHSLKITTKKGDSKKLSSPQLIFQSMCFFGGGGGAEKKNIEKLEARKWGFFKEIVISSIHCNFKKKSLIHH